MNITKAFCLSIALLGASNMQAITNSDFVIQQDNTQINNYQTNRPEASKRLFVSQAVEQQIAHIKQLLTNARLAWMFENCFPNTLDTTVHFDGKDDTFVYTGDIHAMWLRDSGAQVWPYVQLANKDAKLKKMLAGVIKRQFKCINIDPYANAFNMNSEGGEWMSDLTDMKPELHERKWEIDSLCYPIRLAYHYWKTTGDASIFSDEWLTAIAKVLKKYLQKQRKNYMAERNLDFDKVINRKNTRCLKYDFAVKRGKPADVLPLWVADMDFETSSYIEDALVERAKEGIFGYSEVQTPYFEILANWMKLHHNWEIQEDWLIKTPGVVFALAMAVKAYTQPGDSVLIQLPVYYPFSEVIQDNGRKVVSSNLYQGEDNRYHIDFQDFEKKIVEENVKLFFLCNPHNPVGRVWSAEELEKIGDICVKNGVTVVSDEIHQDFVFKGKHQVFAGLKKEFQDISITCTSPSKTFNLASMMISNIFIPNPELRRRFRKQLDAAGTSQLGVLGLVATEAAYSKGEEWYQAMHAYVEANINYTKEYVEKYLPGVKMTDLEGTYLVWLDFRETGLTVEELEDLILNKARLWLDSGKIFGKAGEGFQRINVACPRATLTEALERIRKAF